MERTARRATAALAATTLAWGSTFVVVRDLVGTEGASALPPLSLVCARFAVAGAAALAVALAARARFDAATIGRGLLLGAITAGGFGFQTLGLQHTTAARSAFITNVSLLLVPVFGMAAGRPRPGAALWAGALVAMGGLYVLEFPWDWPAEGPGSGDRLAAYLRGDLLTVGCAVFFAIQILATESFSPRCALLPLVAVQLLACSAVVAPFAILAGEAARLPDPGAIPSRVSSELAYLAVVATGACLTVQAWAQRHVSATRAALIFLLEPVVAVLLAWIAFGDRLTTVQWAGAGIVLAGIAVAELAPARRARES